MSPKEPEDDGHFETASEEPESPKNRTSKKPASKSTASKKLEKTQQQKEEEEEEERRVSEDEGSITKVLSSDNDDVDSAKHELPHPLSRIDNQSQLSYIPITYVRIPLGERGYKRSA
ncbi:hypothetical protein DFP72DRAFT_1081053 [Ephemerocybe angulata]|uniref:Uncharacterized protein n=1 Tax=Ephemerocybe angulata TaxID=980116 RepID=A0A8H6H9H9_9AGAR|nr:hypothetical protein DFP72DRAFT_1081053 [Tulosesus angulatus]